MVMETRALIIGAGPFGLSLSAHAHRLGIEHAVVGRPMSFWKTNMPEGMYLRSASDWHLDADNEATIVSFLESRGLTPKDVEPISRDFYLAYCQWFQDQKKLTAQEVVIERLDWRDGDSPRFIATTVEGETITARQVVLALGFEYFKHIPASLMRLVPEEHRSHTCDHVDFSDLEGKRCLIVGGRQSAFEWAALLKEAGVREVHVSHRHASPGFREADWTWVPLLVDGMIDNPGWFRGLPPGEQEAVNLRLWSEGRLKVEPWLESRLADPSVRIWPRSELVACAEQRDGSLTIRLSNDETLEVDHVIFATGYKPQVGAIPLVAAGNLLPRIETRNGFPVLDERFQTSLPGLYMTSMLANQDFGPFFGFTVAVRTSARLIGHALAA
jgi:FAD-dependent urate hydroxylase